MRKALLPAALVVLLGPVVDMTPLSAQTFQAQPSAPPVEAAPEPMRRPSAARARIAHTARPEREVHRKRHVIHAPPDLRKVAEKKGFKALSDLVNFPKFFPGLGIIYVKPDSLPLGPFLCFDRSDHLVATVYMVSIKDIDDHKTFEAPGFAGKVDHFSYYFNAGHPGMDMPHYHIVIWHVPKDEEARVAH